MRPLEASGADKGGGGCGRAAGGQKTREGSLLRPVGLSDTLKTEPNRRPKINPERLVKMLSSHQTLRMRGTWLDGEQGVCTCMECTLSLFRAHVSDRQDSSH